MISITIGQKNIDFLRENRYSKMIRFFPIAYHSGEDKRGVFILVFAYDDTGRKIAIRFRYPYWFYANCKDHSVGDIQRLCAGLHGIGIPSDIPEHRRSTVDQHQVHKVLRINAANSYAKNKAIETLTLQGVRIHENDNMLSPLLKMMAEKDVRYYQWMEVSVRQVEEKLTTLPDEYIGDLSTLKVCTEELPPPEFSIFSFDGEMNSSNWNKMSDARSDPSNAICILGCTFKSKDIYAEHAIVYGPDITGAKERHAIYDIHIHTCTTEIEAIMKMFKLIEDYDPDIIAGHNIIGFDNQYILDRYRYLVADGNRDPSYKGPKDMKLPNISRLRNHSVTVHPVEWNNSQVSMSGIYFDYPGRIWIDTLIVGSRGLLGNLKNNKLETLGKEILGMGKNDMPYKDMFRGFDLYFKWNLLQSNQPGIPFTRESISEKVSEMYEKILDLYNKKLPTPKVKTEGESIVTKYLNELNELIQMINVMNQREKKIKILSAKDITSEEQCISLYEKYQKECSEAITRWNISLDKGLSTNDKIATIWYIITLYCVQDTRIPYQVITQQALVFMLREQSSTFSVSIGDVLMKGQVYTTTSSQYRYNYRCGFMMDFGNHGGPIAPYEYEGGYVGKGESGLKIKDDDSVIFVIDFASLYPTIIIAYNICYTTWVAYPMREPYIGEILTADGSRVQNPQYVWNKYKDVIPERLKMLRKELEKYNIYDLVSEIESRRQYVREHIGKELSVETFVQRKPYVGKSYGDDADKCLMYVAELFCILDAPYEEKGKYMCNIFCIENAHTKEMHVHWFLRPSILPGVVPVMLWEQYLTRKVVKGKMGAAFKAGNVALGITYNAQQDGIKRSMNATYGGFGTKTNRLANFAGAEVITWVGRQSIQHVNAEVEKKGLGETVYNDTDSAMVRISGITERFGRDIAKIREHGINAAKELSSMFQKPMSLECENFFVAFFLKGPKMYSGIKWDEKSLDINHYTWEYINARNLLYIKGMAPVRRDKYTYSKQLFMKVLYHILVRSGAEVCVQLLEYALVQIWKLRSGIVRGKRTDEQWKKYLSEIERLFAYNMGVTAKASQGGDGTMAKWCNIYAQKTGRKPAAGDRFELLVSVYNGKEEPSDKHTKSPYKLVTMDWLLEEGRQLDIEHYILQLSNDGNVADIIHTAYKEEFPRTCVDKYYLKKLKTDGYL